MTYPTTTQLTGDAGTLDGTDFRRLASRLEGVIERDRRGGSAIPDGYPPSTLGGGGTSELTSTEAAVVARQGARDEHHDRTRYAVGYWEQMLLSLAALVSQLDRLEGDAVHVRGREPGCRHHARHGFPYEVTYRRELCRACYDFEHDHGRLPPAKLLDDRARGIHWTSASIARAMS